MFKKTIIIFLFSFCSSTGFSQSIKSLLRQGEEAMKDQNYFSAAQIYNQIILLDSLTINYQYAYAEASRLNYDFDISLHWYEKVYKKDNAKLFPETTFWMGTILKSKSKYKEAKKLFTKFYQKNKSSRLKERKALAEKAKLESEACDLALLLIKSPLDVKIEHLDTTVNSKVSEYAPFEVDSVLFFSSLRINSDKDKLREIYFNKVYKSGLIDNNFKRSELLDTIFNNKGIHTANTAFNNDLTRAYITRCSALNSSKFVCEIWMSEYKNGNWLDFIKLPSPVNIQGNTSTQPAIAILNEEEYLFFSSDRSGGEGGMDIWFGKLNSSGWPDLVSNAGKIINSMEDEITPFFVSEKQTLYFSSTWHKGLGGFDIFKSEFKGGIFGVVENAGYPINSSLNDVYFSINTSKDKAYLSSNRLGSYFEEKQSCCNDIYRFSIPPLSTPKKPVDSSVVILNQMKVLVPLTLFFHNDEPDPKTQHLTTKKNYKTTYEDYSALRGKYFVEYAKGLNGDEKSMAENKLENFFEDSVDAGMRDLEKFAELLEKVLARKEKVKITMKGYCSPLASTDYNINLAKRRISSLENYFREYKNGLFLKYIDNSIQDEGSITFFEEEIGELESSKVSDDIKDKRNSVYSPYAAAERKIQIIAVSYLK